MTDQKVSRVLDLAISMPWAITEDYLRTILNVAAREEMFSEVIAFREDPQPVQNRETRIRNGVAIIPITGPIFRRANLFMRFSGGTSTELLALEIGEALRNRSVNTIAFDIDSPGGEANGVAEVAEMIYRARATKPSIAYVNDLGASGAYWLASAASAVVTSPTGLLGSIGVRTAFTDFREADEKRGIRHIEIVSSQSPKKAPDPATSEGLAEIQRVIDDLAEVFVGSVARNRGVDRETVLSDFGAGGLLVGQEAVEAGLADRMGTFEEVMEAIESGADWVPTTTEARMDIRIKPDNPADLAPAVAGLAVAELERNVPMKSEEKQTTPEITAAYVEENHPAVAEGIRSAGLEQAKAEARREGAAAERDRIKAIEDLEQPGCEELIAELKYEPEMTAEKAALRIVGAQKEKRDRQVKNLRGDEQALDAPDPSVEGGGSDVQKEVAASLALYHRVNGGAQKQLQQ